MAFALSAGGDLFIRDVEIEGRPHLDCLVLDGSVAAIGTDLADEGADVVAGHGGALLPGLADHHLHLFAMAAAASSLDLSPYDDLTELERLDRSGEWVRVVGWDERHGDLDRDRLDALLGDRPIRVQHRSGALWVLNSAGLRLALDTAPRVPEGAERDATGRLTGRLWRADAWLRDALGDLPNLAAVASSLSEVGVTAVTDATPDHDARAVDHLIRAVEDGVLPQRLQLTCTTVPASLPARMCVGPQKLVVADHALPDPDVLAAQVSEAHAAGRAVAVHCVSRDALALTLFALRHAGSHPGDRIEHCAIADAHAIVELAALGVTVVTQPSLVARRGDLYIKTHDPADHDDLWRFDSLVGAGIATVASSDAPYGDHDPWATIRAARDRVTASGTVLGPGERVAPARTLSGFLAPLDRPGGQARKVEVGADADLVLLTAPLTQALTDPGPDLVATTVCNGRVVHSR